MKKPQFKLLKEFKAFINKGSVLDLAVGMIIGSAFTAIITALVNGLLKPLINWIPISETGDLITVLRPAVVNEAGAVVKEALVLDWGSVISAIITFLLTAVVLFAIIKAINTAKSFGSREAAKLAKAVKRGKISEEEAAAKQAELDAQKAAEATPAEPAPIVETTDDLLREIRDLLKAQQLSNAQLNQIAETVENSEVQE